MAIGDGSWLKKTFPNVHRRRKARRLKKASNLHENKNVSMEKRSGQLDSEIADMTKNFPKEKIKIRRLTDEKKTVDRRRKYDSSSAGDAQMKIDDYVGDRNATKSVLASLQTKLEGASQGTKVSVQNEINQAKKRLKEIQSNINGLYQIVKKHKLSKVVKSKEQPKDKPKEQPKEKAKKVEPKKLHWMLDQKVY